MISCFDSSKSLASVSMKVCRDSGILTVEAIDSFLAFLEFSIRERMLVIGETFKPGRHMDVFEPLCDFFHRRQAKNLNQRAEGVLLVTQRAESCRGSFAFPGTEFVATIKVDGQRAGRICYGINPLNDRGYIYDPTIEVDYRRRGLVTVVQSPGATAASARSGYRRGVLEQGV